MGEPSQSHVWLPTSEHIGRVEGTRGSETSQYPQEEKTTCDSVSSGERKRMRVNLARVIPGRGCALGVVGPSGLFCRTIGESENCVLVEWSGKADRRR
jgi:hypothetical protein